MSTIIISLVVGAVAWKAAKFHAVLKMVKKYRADPEGFVATVKGAAEKLDAVNAHIADIKKRRTTMTPEEADAQVKRSVKLAKALSKMTADEIKNMTTDRFKEMLTGAANEPEESEAAK